jgi:serine phosphatase RsbU (regulator of sigma subunit)/PAS domain-containing protein
MEGLPVSALAPRPFSRGAIAGGAGVVLVAALDAALAGELALVGLLAAVALITALTARFGDTVVVALLGVAAGIASGAWNGWDAAWGYGLGAVIACMALAVLVGVLRASAVTTERRLGVLRDLAGLVQAGPGGEPIADRVLDVIVPTFADGATLEVDDRELATRGPRATGAGPAREMPLTLMARGIRFGRLTLTLAPTGRRFSSADRSFGYLVAGRVAIVLDNSGLTRQAAEAERRMVAALDALGEAVTMNGPDGRTVYANQAAVELLDARDARELTSGEVGAISARFEMFDESGKPMELDDFPAFKALRGDDRPAPVLVHSIVRATGEERWLMNKVTVLRAPDGSIDRVVNVVDDVSDVKRAELAQRLLSEATRLLSSSLDYGQTLQRVAEVATGGLADWCAVDLPAAGGRPRLVGFAHTDPEQTDAARERWLAQPVRDDPVGGVAHVIRTGVTVQRPPLADEPGIGSLIIVPLVAGGAPLGALTLAREERARRLTDADRALAEQLGQRAGIAVLNARLYSERAEIARDLQQGLLPPRLPDIPGLEVATFYRPAGELNEVGGDFYDAFPTPRGWVVVIGHVPGQGARAAALTGLARFTLRSVGQLTGDPVRAAEQLNATLRDQPEMSLCTAACVLLESDDGTITATTVSCGHPLPILRREGKAVALGRPGTLAGAFDEGDWPAETVGLRAGDELVLYTDGVYDTVGLDGRLGEARLTELLAAGPPGAEPLIRHVEAELDAFESGPQADDTAVVVLAVTGLGGEPR